MNPASRIYIAGHRGLVGSAILSRWEGTNMGTVGTYEVKTHLSKLLDRVEKGERITITRHGVPIAVIVPAAPGKKTAAEAIEDIRALRAGMKLNGLDLKELIEEGRR